MTHDTLIRTFIAGVLASNLASSTLIPTQQTAPQPPAEDQANRQPASGSEVSVVGCLVRTDTSARRPGTSGTTLPAPAAYPTRLGFALKEAIVWTGAPISTGPVETRSTREFGLTTNKDIRLGHHANHQVEIRGWLVSSRDPDHDVLPLPPSHDGNFIRIDSVRTLSDHCPP
jgi:hypothetical protein